MSQNNERSLNISHIPFYFLRPDLVFSMGIVHFSLSKMAWVWQALCTFVLDHSKHSIKNEACSPRIKWMCELFNFAICYDHLIPVDTVLFFRLFFFTLFFCSSSSSHFFPSYNKWLDNIISLEFIAIQITEIIEDEADKEKHINFSWPYKTDNTLVHTQTHRDREKESER